MTKFSQIGIEPEDEEPLLSTVRHALTSRAKSPLRTVASIVLVIATFLFAPLQAHASATLKSEISVYANVVTAKDLFDNAGEFANEPLFLAPDLGKSGTISAHRVAKEAHDIGLYDISLDGIDSVQVHRPSQRINREDIIAELMENISGLLTNGIDFEINTTAIPSLTHADPRTTKALAIKNLRLIADEKRFEATVSVKMPRGHQNLPVRGTIIEMRSVAALTRDMRRDDVIQTGDVELKRLPRSRVRAGTLSSIDGLVGKAVTRNLSQGSLIREQEVIEPLIVRTNELVFLLYTVPGLILTAQGRALDSGAKGAIISVKNLQSNRVVRGRITDKGEVMVDVRKPLFVDNNPSGNGKIR